jgi:hypothetical protein
MTGRGRAAASAAIALACFALLVVTLAALHVLRPENDPLTRRLSEYAVGRFGYLMTAAFLLAGAGLVGLWDALGRAVTPSLWLRLGRSALLAAGAANLLMAVFTAQPWPAGEVAHPAAWSRAWIHDRLAMLHALGWSAAIVTVPPGLWRDPRWRGLARGSTAAGAAVVAGLAVRVLAPAAWIGLTQRTWIAAVLVWSLFHCAAILRRTTAGAAARVASDS